MISQFIPADYTRSCTNRCTGRANAQPEAKPINNNKTKAINALFFFISVVTPLKIFL